MTPFRLSRDSNGINRRSRVPSEILNPLGLYLLYIDPQ